jgi:hypothetical protein
MRRVRAAKAAARKENLRHERRGSVRLVEAAQRLGEMLRSEDVRTAAWADNEGVPRKLSIADLQALSSVCRNTRPRSGCDSSETAYLGTFPGLTV